MTEDEWRAAAAKWPEIKLDAARFLAHARARRDEGGALPEHLSDLYLACAVAAGDAASLRILDERFLAAIDVAVRSVDASPAFLEELRQQLRLHLLLGEGGAPPRIASYKGRGPLLAWIRVAATRVALNLKRAERAPVAQDEVLAELAAHDADPELSHLKQLYRAEFGQALREAVAALPERERALLRLHFVEGLRLARIAALYEVHESTASRWVSKAVEDLGADALRRLRHRLSLSAESVDSIARLLRSEITVSIGRLLADDTPGTA